jgi:ADP-dependent NAD(P)H-hydrate dehydratase / NAD(P)H-hydrate epimerase
MPKPVVTTAQMQAIEARLFAAGMPVAALMEKVALRITALIKADYPLAGWPRFLDRWAIWLRTKPIAGR